jgi:hypothetical protein
MPFPLARAADWVVALGSRHCGRQPDPIAAQLLFTNTVPTNSEHYVGQDLPDPTADDATDDSAEGSGQAEAGDTEAGPLHRSQDAIDQGWEAARAALKDTLPDKDMNLSQSEQNTDPEAGENPMPRRS